MNDDELSDFRTWMDAQPDYCSYSRVRNFLSGLLEVNNSQAEVVMAKLSGEEIKIISKKAGGSGRRVFLLPLEELTENHIRAVWNGSASVTQDVNMIATSVHDKTGHDVSDIKQFMRSSDECQVNNGTFRWNR